MISWDQWGYSALATTLAIYFYKKWDQKKKLPSDLDLLPGPSAIFDRLEGIRASINRKSHTYFMLWARKLNFKMFKIQVLSSKRSVMICDASSAKQILTGKEFIRPDTFQKVVEGILDHALFVLATGEDHKRHRKLIQPGFGPSHLKAAARVSVNKSDELISVWNQKFKGLPSFQANMYKTLATVTIDIISLIAFGHDLQSVAKLSNEEEAKWDPLEVLTGPSLAFRAVLPKSLWRLFGVSSSSPRIFTAKKEINDLLQRLADEKKQNGLESESTWGMDVLSRLLKGGQDGIFSEEEIQGELFGFFLAGHETSSNTLAFACLELCLNPQIQESLFQEVKSIDLNDMDNPAEALPPLKYLDAIFREVQRLHSIVGSVGRVATKNVVIDGKNFPAGTIFQVYIRAIHLNPLYYTSPDEFRPDRWINDPPPPIGAFLPFSDGVHNCIGKKMAEIEIKIILVKLVQTYQLQLIPNSTVELFTTITHGLKDGFSCNLTIRK